MPPREALPGPDTASWAGLDAYVQLMRCGGGAEEGGRAAAVDWLLPCWAH